MHQYKALLFFHGTILSAILFGHFEENNMRAEASSLREMKDVVQELNVEEDHLDQIQIMSNDDKTKQNILYRPLLQHYSNKYERPNIYAPFNLPQQSKPEVQVQQQYQRPQYLPFPLPSPQISHSQQPKPNNITGGTSLANFDNKNDNSSDQQDKEDEKILDPIDVQFDYTSDLGGLNIGTTDFEEFMEMVE